MTSQPDGVVVYTPFPDYEREVAAGGTVTERTTYSIAGQMVAVRSAGTLYYTYGDHLGSVVAMSWLGGTYRDGSLTRYDPFGNYRTWPGSNVNPLISDRGFTGHVHDNTGPYPTQNLGLIYMNARYYLPEVGRFISADTIVPEPENPQSFNRYAYSFNNPVNYTDPSGHMATSGCDGVFEGCLSDADNWGANFVSYLHDYIDFNDPASNPQGQIFLELYNYVLPLGQADGASINEIVSQVIVDTVSFIKHGRDSWYPIASDADLLVKTLLFASVAEAGTDSSINGEQGSVIPQYDRNRYGSWKRGIREMVHERDNYTCSYCGKQIIDPDLTVDHVDSANYHWYFRGGHAMTDSQRNAWFNDTSNLVTACRSCNSSKQSDSLLWFLFRRFGQ